MAPMPSPQVETAEPARDVLEAMRAQHAALLSGDNDYGQTRHNDNSAHPAEDRAAALAAVKLAQGGYGLPVDAEKPHPGERPYIMDTMWGSTLKASGKRPWRINGLRGTYTAPPICIAADQLEADFAAALRSIANKGARLPNLRFGGGKLDLEAMGNLAARLARDGVRKRDLLLEISKRAHVILKPTSSGEQVTMRALRKARTLLVRHRRWPKPLG